MSRISNTCLILAVIHGIAVSSQTCSELEFLEFSENTLNATDRSTVRLHFHLNTKRCSETPDEFTIKVIQEKDSGAREVCKIRRKSSEQTCTESDTSHWCRCLPSDEKMLFSKQVTKDDGGVYVWKWTEGLKSESEKKFTLRIYEADPPPESDAKQREAEVYPLNVKPAVHQQSANSELDVKLIISSAILVGVVVVAVCAGVLIFLSRGRRRDNRELSSIGGGAFPNPYQLPIAPPVPREQASDIYDEIPHHAKLQNAGSGVSPSTLLLPRKSSSVNLAQLDGLTCGKVCSREDSVEYLDPVTVCMERKVSLPLVGDAASVPDHSGSDWS